VRAALLWEAFARRGLGVGADQGSPMTNADNVEDFGVPTAAEPGAAPPTFRLHPPAPNPFAERARFALEVATSQHVRVAVYDAIGREVAVLHDGVLAAGVAHPFTVEGRELASGTYLVRATDAAFAATRRLTLLR
jgi:hypothetical protein